MTEPVPSAPSPGTKGPIGEARNPTLVIVLTIITCGIYGLYWLYKSFEELKQHNGEGLGGVVGAILGLFWVSYFILPIEIQKTYEADGRHDPGQRDLRPLASAAHHRHDHLHPARAGCAERLLGVEGRRAGRVDSAQPGQRSTGYADTGTT